MMYYRSASILALLASTGTASLPTDDKTAPTLDAYANLYEDDETTFKKAWSSTDRMTIKFDCYAACKGSWNPEFAKQCTILYNSVCDASTGQSCRDNCQACIADVNSCKSLTTSDMSPWNLHSGTCASRGDSDATESQCENYAKQFGIPYTGTLNNCYNPPGCFHHTSAGGSTGMKVFFNSCAATSGCSSTKMCICGGNWLNELGPYGATGAVKNESAWKEFKKETSGP